MREIRGNSKAGTIPIVVLTAQDFKDYTEAFGSRGRGRLVPHESRVSRSSSSGTLAGPDDATEAIGACPVVSRHHPNAPHNRLRR